MLQLAEPLSCERVGSRFLSHVHSVNSAETIGGIAHEWIVHQLLAQARHIAHQGCTGAILPWSWAHHWVLAVTHRRTAHHLGITAKLTCTWSFPRSPRCDAHHVNVIWVDAWRSTCCHGIEVVFSILVLLVVRISGWRWWHSGTASAHVVFSLSQCKLFLSQG